jgi:hypothetical protein
MTDEKGRPVSFWGGKSVEPLAQPAPVQEPVAWGCNRYIEDDNGFQIGTDEPELAWGKYAPDDNGWWPLYTTPPAAQQEPNFWNVIDPAGNIVASEKNAIRGWARIAGSYKPTVEALLGFHYQGWRVLPKVTLPAAQRQWVGLTDEEIKSLDCVYLNWLDYEEVEIKGEKEFARAIEAKLKGKNA